MSGRYDISIDESRSVARRRLAAVFCSIALLFNILCGVALSRGAAHANRAARAFANGWSIACATSGLTIIDADGKPVRDDQTGQPAAAGPRCLFCLPLMHGDVALATPVTVPVPADQVWSRRPSPLTDMHLAHLVSEQAWPRAPPFVLIG